jgi:PAS domain S-box-containing protein
MNDKNEISGIKLKVLVLEDSLRDFELIREQLSEAGYILDLTHVENEAGFTSSLQKNSYDIILSDYRLPGFDAFGALLVSNRICPDTPFICISGSIGEEIAIELLKLGAVDYVLKDRPERLPFSVKRALDEAKEKSAHKKAAIALQQSEHRFKQVAENAQEWIWEVDINGLYTYASPVILSLLGYHEDEIVGKKYFYDFFIPEKKEELTKTALEVFSRKEPFLNFENSNVHKDGQIVILATSGSPIIDDKGNLLGFRGGRF